MSSLASTSPYDYLRDRRRLASLDCSELLDSPAEEAFERLTRMATRLLHAPISLVSLVDDDRQFFKSALGLSKPWSEKRGSKLTHSFCQHVVTSQQPLIVSDARENQLLKDNLAIDEMDVIAYLGMPLTLSDGETLGSFCVIDNQPRQWSEEEIELLKDLSQTVIATIELRSEMRHRLQFEQELALLAELSATLAAAPSANPPLQAIVDRLVPDLADWAVLLQAEQQGGSSMRTWIAGSPAVNAALSATEAGSELQQLLSSGRTAFIESHPNMSLFVENETTISQTTGAVLYLPLHEQDQPVGLFLLGLNFERTFLERHLQLLEELARVLGVVWSNQRLYYELQHALQKRDQFVRVAAHEIKNPVLGFRMALELLSEAAGDKIDEEYRSLIMPLHAESKRLERMVYTLLNTDQLERQDFGLRLETFDLGLLVARIVAEQQLINPQHPIELDLPETPLMIEGDISRLEQVVHNLLQNAIKYSRPHTLITVILRLENSKAILSVCDRGIGIDESASAMIFERFYRGENAQSFSGGLGLGLFLVDAIVSRHGGTIAVMSRLGEGSTFEVRLPLRQPRSSNGAKAHLNGNMHGAVTGSITATALQAAANGLS